MFLVIRMFLVYMYLLILIYPNCSPQELIQSKIREKATTQLMGLIRRSEQ